MADPKDVAANKIVRQMFGRRGIDVTRADLRVMHGVCYIRGAVAAIPGSGITDLKLEVQNIARLLTQKGGIKDVVVDCQFRS
ncbi:MAG: hypothetical protein ABL949_08975 [Fimbriimonadaceae bacterium]